MSKVATATKGAENSLVRALDETKAILGNGGGDEPKRPVSFPDRVKALRARLGLTQQEFAIRYDLELSTIKNWEQGRRKNVGAAAELLIRMIEKDPEGMAERVLECS
ncbi:MAG: helix-turn-helix domain-containing protein [Pseudomonadota bacterium]